MFAQSPVGLRTGITAAIAAIVAMSAAINVLSLGGAIYMLQVYDRVLSSQSVPTLAVLSILLATAYIGLGLLDALRAQLMSRIGARLDAQLATRAFETLLVPGVRDGRRGADNQSLRDLEVVRAFLLGAAPMALFDLPWVPLLVIFIAVLDPTLGWVTIAAIVLVVMVGRLAQRTASHFETASAEAIRRRRWLADAAANSSDLVRTMGIGEALSQRRRRDDEAGSRSNSTRLRSHGLGQRPREGPPPRNPLRADRHRRLRHPPRRPDARRRHRRNDRCGTGARTRRTRDRPRTRHRQCLGGVATVERAAQSGAAIEADSRIGRLRSLDPGLVLRDPRPIAADIARHLFRP